MTPSTRPKKNMPTTVEVLAQAFKDMGTPFIVGHPGGESVELMQAAQQRGMRFILMKQEVAGAMLASTWGEITGSPGVCLSTRGPGAANMVNGVAHAWMDRCPLIAITDQYSAPTLAIGLRQRLDQQALYAPVSKWSTVINAKSVRQQIRRAVRTACALPPGPVHFDMPQSETTQAAGEVEAEGLLMPDLQLIAAERESLKEPLRVLAKSRKPILLVGLGVYWSRASVELVALAEKLGAPVLTTSKCKGAIPEDHLLRAGCIIGGLIERKLIQQADLIVTVGLDAIELQPKAWPYTLPVMSLASVANLDALVPASPEVVGDLKSILAGASRLLVVQKWQSYGAREFLTSNGLGSMGFAIPGALGARLAHPNRPIVAFTGDGGFMMAVAELQTSVREKLPIIVVVFDDEEIALIRVKQELKGIPSYGVKIGGIDWEKLAQGFGADGVVVDNEHALGDALKAALKSGRTTVIGARIDGSGYVAQFNALREL